MRTQTEIIEELLKIVEAQRQEIIFLKERIAELERRLNLNSQNSSKPPSSDGLRKPNPKSLREKGKNKSGGQPNHRGETLYQSLHPDHVILHKLESCPKCNNLLNGKPLDIIKRQVFDLSIPQVEITEHQIQVKCCTLCDEKVSSKFPTGVNAPVQYGPRVKAFSIYLQNQHFIPEIRLKAIFKDIFNLPVACATLSNFSQVFSSKLSVFLDSVNEHIYRAKIKHLDETGMQIEKKPQWLHVACTKELTHYRISERGDVPDKMLGIVVHDHWRSYFAIKKAKHVICNIHILRELKGIIEEDKEIWSKKMFRLLQLACKVKNKYPEGIPKKWTEFIESNYFKIIEEGILYHENLPPLMQKKKCKPKRRVGHNLLLRLEYYREETLRFLYDKDVPFTNNQAEQDIRMMKVKQKISGCFRSFAGAETFCRVRSLLSTARKQGWNILNIIEDALNGQMPIFDGI
jgi:transposase